MRRCRVVVVDGPQSVVVDSLRSAVRNSLASDHLTTVPVQVRSEEVLAGGGY